MVHSLVSPEGERLNGRVGTFLYHQYEHIDAPNDLIKRERAWCVINRDGALDDLPSIPVRFLMQCSSPTLSVPSAFPLCPFLPAPPSAPRRPSSPFLISVPSIAVNWPLMMLINL